MKHKKVFFLLLIILSSCRTFSAVPSEQAQVPKWVREPEKVYPKAEYLKAVGEGKSLEAAQNSALSAIALAFKTKTDVRNVAISNMTHIREENSSVYEVSQKLIQIVNISSDAEFFCTNFSEPYFDKKEKKYSVFAYINRNEAELIYKERINHIVNMVKDLFLLSQKEPELFIMLSECQNALGIAKLAEEYINNAVIINPQNSKSYADELKLFEDINKKIADNKGKVLFSVKCNNDKCLSLENHLISLLEKKGFTYTQSQEHSLYVTDINISIAEEHFDAGEFVRPTLKILIKNKDGKSLKSYSKSYTRYGAKTMEAAYTRGLLRVQEDLTDNFLSEF